MSLYLGENCISAGGSSAFRNTNIGEIIQSTIPLTDAGLHLLDGSVISGSGAYSAFVTHIAGLVSGHSELFTTEANWQTSNDNYGACDKFVYDSVNNTVRLPKRVTDHGVLIKSYSSGTDWYRIYSDGWCEQGGVVSTTMASSGQTHNLHKAFVAPYSIIGTLNEFASAWSAEAMLRIVRTSYSTFTIQCGGNGPSPGAVSWQACGYTDISDLQQTPVYEYIVIANSVKTPVEVDIDEVMTDLNGKVDIADLATCHVVVETYVNGSSWYRVYDDGWVEQGGMTDVLASNVVTTITLLKAMLNTKYTITACERYDNGTSDNNNENYWVSIVSTESFGVYNSAGGYKNLYWIVSGYKA